MGKWNYRIIMDNNPRTAHAGVYEVYYNEEGGIDNRTEEPIIAGNDVADLEGEIEHITEAFKAPVLDLLCVDEEIEGNEG